MVIFQEVGIDLHVEFVLNGPVPATGRNPKRLKVQKLQELDDRAARTS